MKEIEDIAVIQEILFDTLSYFDGFCRKNNLEYFLSNGTLLGAAKYKNFIPWDDDVDILMPRESYDRLVKLKRISNERYRLLTGEQLPEWRMPYAKLSDMRTLVKEGQYDFGTDIGLSIDIFPLDNWNPIKPLANLEAVRGELLKRFLVASIGETFQTKKQGVKKWILKSIWKIGQKTGYVKLLKKIKRTSERTRSYRCKYMGCVAWTCHLTAEVLPKEIFEHTTLLRIRNKEFPAPIGFETYLSALYGNWKCELPPEKRHSNHEIKVWWK